VTGVHEVLRRATNCHDPQDRVEGSPILPAAQSIRSRYVWACEKIGLAVDAERSRRQRVFSLESELCAALKPAFDKAIGRSGTTRLIAQVQVGMVIPDFIAVWGANNGSKRLFRQISDYDAWILAELLKARLRPTTIARRLYSRAEKVQTRLTRLEAIGLVRRTPSGAYGVKRGAFPRGVRVVAVEVKLHRWRDAVRQANAYLSFANHAYVALPYRTIKSAVPKLRDACRQAGVGLLAVDHRHSEVVLRSPRHQPLSPKWVLLVAKTSPIM
jgi:hypothetical protein